MRVNEQCAECLLDKQMNKISDPDYLAEVKSIIENRKEWDTAPYLVYLFNEAFERRFGRSEPYKNLKHIYNDFVLSMEDEIRQKIESDTDPLAASLAFARIGNYIDFGAMNHVDKSTFISLLESSRLEKRDLPAFESLKRCCETAGSFLLIADNCGEIVLDRLFLEQLHKSYPKLELSVMVRGSEVLNDVTVEDALYVRMDKIAKIISNGTSVAGTIYDMISEEARKAVDQADIILAKGQGNYESLYGQGYPAFYSLLCKCDLFTNRFNVPKLTGILVQEQCSVELDKRNELERTELLEIT